jgi:hypothetical protein
MKGDREMAEALRGLINSGFDRAGARYIMKVPVPGGGYEPRQFSTWAPQLLSGIGTLPETVRDRAIEIEMVRKRPDETVRRLRRRDGGDLHVVCQKLDLVAKLIAREDRPWAEFGHARKPITTIRLASLLRGYKIKPATSRIGSGDKDTAKGYKHSQFVDAFERYLPASANRAVTPSQSSKIKEFGSNRTVTRQQM